MSLQATFDGLKRSFERFRHNVLAAINVLWIVRVSAVSLIAGALLFTTVPPVRDTFLEMRGDRLLSWNDVGRWLFFFVSAVLFWALPVHYAARRNLRHDPRFFGNEEEQQKEKPTAADWWSLWIPRLLGVACLAAIAVGAFMAQNALRVVPPAFGSRQLEAANQYQYDVIADYTTGIAVLALLLCVGLWIFLQQRKYIFGGTPQKVGNVLLIALLCAFVVLLFIPVNKFTLARAPLIPLLIGGWIPLLALLAHYGRVTRLPLILGLFLVLEIAAVYATDHKVRDLWAWDGDSLSRIPPENGGPRFIRPSLDNAINGWKTINCPLGLSCPRPIVVAASGGASRAGFFTAASLGYLLDESRTNPRMNDFRNQLFAISSVSGSSTGAAFFAAALRAEKNDGSNPCGKPDESGLAYFSAHPVTWKECMEQLLAGDFISSTLFSYVFKDAAQGIGAAFGIQTPDRAAVLEKTWESRFCQIAGPQKCNEEEFEGLEAPFLWVTNHNDKDRAAGKWYPLLFFNSTDVDTGRRVIVSPVLPHTKSGDRIFTDAYDLHELLADNPEHAEARPLGNQAAQPGALERDVSLSTAALLSARFPLISPPGVVLNRNKKVVARLIDGGYFENFGALTALELARHLKQAGLDPFVIEITNDPELLVSRRTVKPSDNDPGSLLCKVDDFDPLCDADPPVNEIQQNYWFSDVRGPLSGLFGSRNAHGGQALRNLAGFAGPKTSFCPSQRDTNGPSSSGGQPIGFVHLVVHPQYQVSWWDRFVPWEQKICTRVEVPLNWWLSKPVQRYLDHQIEKANEPAIEQVFKVMEKGTGVSAPAIPPC